MTLGKLFTLAHDDHRVAEAHDQIHVVLDEEEGYSFFFAELSYMVYELLHERRIHARTRLIEHSRSRNSRALC